MPALDQNLFTLKLKRSEEEPGALDLVDPQGTIYYRKRLIPPSKLGEPGPSGVPLYDLWGERMFRLDGGCSLTMVWCGRSNVGLALGHAVRCPWKGR